MNPYRHLKPAAAGFLAAVLGKKPNDAHFYRALACLPAIRPPHCRPQPSRRPSGVAAARRAKKQRRKAGR